ncbi:hypothetical protein PIN31115_04496 [Pandoraea iniqua]|uniref:Uncharacterized protein n=1 Tax=Pandoraea iniqua TaxID=2508288 RepID=A0A5E4YHX4_9BURK|nr:hypothetical protein [Pandoraea iniqua]VVE47975.1 hypothetical protein PIN31115_04496 [Pandoraea iniqua]
MQVSEFAQLLGLENWSMNDDGVAQVTLGADRLLSIERAGPNAVIVATWRCPFLDASVMEAVLRTAWVDEATEAPTGLMQTALLHNGADSTLVLAHRRPAGVMRASDMEHWATHFFGLFDALEQRSA